MSLTRIILVFCVTLLFTHKTQSCKLLEIKKMVNNVSEELGRQLWEYSDSFTRRNETILSFRNSSITNENGTLIHAEIVKNLENMFNNKIKAVENIMREAEMLALHRKKDIETNSSYDYYNTDNITITTLTNEEEKEIQKNLLENEQQWKCDYALSKQKVQAKKCKSVPYIERKEGYFNKLSMEYDSHFKTSVNTNFSAVRVSPAVYWRQKDVLNDIRWSEALDTIFKKNFENDPTLTWQYFGSPKGFMRQYPAMAWSEERYDKTYDFRIRSWFTEAMTSPKDVVILVDKSGSMNGTNRFMSKYIINDMLDTFYDNDFINIYLFDNTTVPLVKCFGDTLVQANEENLRLLRESLGGYRTQYPSDLGLALEKAFQLLARYRTRHSGATQCNQIILIITEGIDYYYTDIFRKYNSDKHVRVFTYQIGTEPGDQDVLEWMACSNMGYYVNLTLVAEAHEKALKYLTVMSRPFNMHPEKRKPVPVWSALYVDLADRRLTNWLWEKYQGNRQRDVYIKYAQEVAKKKGWHFEDDAHYLMKKTHPYEIYRTPRSHTFLTTISMPVYDLRPNQTDVLGVAAVDITKDLINSLIAHYRIGVNGYAFIITNNGYLILHPDHRTEFEHILKPTFNRVDMVEVEIMDDNTKPRLFNKSTIVWLRDKILKHSWGHKHFAVRTHLDDMKRIILSDRHYFYGPLGPAFSLIIALPADYGFWNVQHFNDMLSYKQEKIHRPNRTWTLHPEWHYCKKYGHKLDHASPEDELLYYLNKTKGFDVSEKHCDRRLVKTILGDFNLTEWFEEDILKTNKLKFYNYEFRIIRVFLATHSGLTRWQDVENPVPDKENHFSKINNKAVDEVWYRRAAHANQHSNTVEFIYSVPFDAKAGNFSEINVTATNVIFVRSGDKKAPVAAVGYQFYQKYLALLFRKCANRYRDDTKLDCDKSSMDFFLLDDNGFVVVSDEDKDIGHFFGDIRADVLNMLVRDGIYRRIRFFDYQAICYFDPIKVSSGKRHFSVIRSLLGSFKWLVSSLFSIIKRVAGFADWKEEIRNQTREFKARQIKKKVPTPCDEERYLYTYVNTDKRQIYPTTQDENWYYVAKKVPKSNLLVLVINNTLPQNMTAEKFTPMNKEIKYDTILPCYIATKNNYTKRGYIPCFRPDIKEKNLNSEDKKYCMNMIINEEKKKKEN